VTAYPTEGADPTFAGFQGLSPWCHNSAEQVKHNLLPPRDRDIIFYAHHLP